MYTNFALYLSNAANKKLLENKNLNKIFTTKNFESSGYDNEYGVTYLNSFLSVKILNPFDETSEFAAFLFYLEPKEKKEYYSICYYNLDDEENITIRNYNNYPKRKFLLDNSFEYTHISPDISMIFSNNDVIEIIG